MRYDDAVRSVRRAIAAERAEPLLNPLGVTRLLDHGRRTERSIVLFHGFTNCPQQFVQLGEMLYDRGYNVLIPRIPRHGMRDRLTDALVSLSYADIETIGAMAYAWATGLGEETDAAGISLGGVIAAWLAQTRTVHTALVISPFFSLPIVPTLVSDLLAQVMVLGPSLFLWWDPRLRERTLPNYAYPRYPTRALGQCILLGQSARTLAKTTSPSAERIVVILNEKEPATNNAAARSLEERWRAYGAPLETEVWDDVGRRHDVIDPTTFPQAPELVYPRLIALLNAARNVRPTPLTSAAER
jgi:alpha-beta hydrolase superfamily lysophospholipase